MGNVNVSSIMRFEDLLELWQGRHTQQSVLEFLGIRSRGDVRGAEESGADFMRVLRERLNGTWWEVTWSRLSIRGNSASAVRCRYLADSLNDAMRRCPGAQVAPETSIDDVDDLMADDELDFPERTQGRRRPMAAWADE